MKRLSFITRFKIYYRLLVVEKSLQKCLTFNKSSTLKCKFPDFWLIAWKLSKFIIPFFKPFVVWKMTWGIRQMFTKALESLRTGTLMGFFYPMQKMFDLKRYRGVMYYHNEKWCKIWTGIGLFFQNWHSNLTNFDPSTGMPQSVLLWWASFDQSIYCLS